MSLARALKIGVGEVIAAIGAVIGVLPGLFKKKPFCLWYLGRDDKWLLKAGPFSHRQCEKTRAELIALGTYLPDRFTILRKGVTP
jgi:hypothetical protein